MNSLEELVCEHKMDRIGELFEQIAMDAVTAALEKIIQRTEHFELQKKKRRNRNDQQF